MKQLANKKPAKSVLSTTVRPEVQERVVRLASEREWSIAQTGEFLIKLGLEKLAEQSAEMNQTESEQQSIAA